MESPARPSVLVVEDDRAVRDSLERALRVVGYDVAVAGDGAAGLAAVHDWRPDIVVLDVMLPVVDGLTACRRLRADGNRVPVLMLTARDALGDRVAGLDAGADDYLPKPFALDELLARLRALLRRAAPETGGVLELADLRLDPGTRLVTRGERVVELTKTEFSLLELLLGHPGQVLTRDVLYDRIWGYVDTGSKALDVYIGYLRRKTEAGGEPRIVHTVRGVGYVARDGG